MPTWKPFYDEVARRVLTFEDRQNELLALVREMKAAGLHAIPLGDGTPDAPKAELVEIDPFTFLANFHRSSEDSRRDLWDFLRRKWNLSHPVPADFDGVPTVYAQQFWFFPYIAERKADDITSLWQLARVAVENPELLSNKLFSRRLDIGDVTVTKLTCVLFWLNAENFLSLDSTMRAYLLENNIVWDDAGIKSGDVSAYRDLMNHVQEKLGSGYPQISDDAWKAKHPVLEMPSTTSQTRFWKLSPGENAYLWENWRDKGLCAIGWPFLGNVAPMNGVELETRRTEIVSHPEQFEKAHRYTPDSVKQVWQFAHDIKEGDFIVANQGTKKVLGIGTVTGPYEFSSEDEHYAHQLPVRWHDTTARDVQQGGWRSTLIELNRAKFDAILNAGAEGAGVPISPVVELNSSNGIEESMPPLNKILYGPPGTGKTYTTIEEAVRIIGGDSPMPHLPNGKVDHAACKRDFDLLRAAGRIGFVTFHQSFSYEEFVEGIRPVLDDATGSARYICRPGVLKDIALRALGAALVPVETGRVTFEQVWDVFIEQTETATEASPDWLLPGIGPSEYRISFTASGNVIGENVKGNAAAPYNASRQNIELVWEKLPESVTPSHNILHEIIGKGAHTNLIGAIVKDLRRIEKSLSPSSITKIDPLEAAKSFLRGSQLYRLDPANAPRFVLIIDEINRGNISKILGELITLLEEDKRLGAENALSVTLPTSGETFALPPNLFVIGTMNTADKSLALLDIALRRRFSFQEMPPRFEVCENLTPAQRVVLTELNIRLTQTRDREHRIGHAYFTNCKSAVDFDRTFHDKIVPLLQEFFYNDWDGLRFVLGESGNNGTFVRALPESGSGRARTRWQWWFDVGEADFSFCDVLLKDYKLTPQAASDLSGVAAIGTATFEDESQVEDETDGDDE